MLLWKKKPRLTILLHQPQPAPSTVHWTATCYQGATSFHGVLFLTHLHRCLLFHCGLMWQGLMRTTIQNWL